MDARRAARRYAWTLALGRLNLVDDTGPVQTAQAQFSGDRLIDNLAVLQQYGLSSRPPADADLLAVFLGGDPTSGVAISSGHQTYRLKNLGDGDVALYDSRGSYAWFKSTGLEVKAPQVKLIGNVEIDGHARVTGGLVVGGGATGTFTTPTGQTVTVRDGIVTNITA